MPEGEAIEARHRQPLDRERAAQGRGAQLRHPQAAARVRRRRQRPAQGDLPAAQRAARERARSRRPIASIRADVLDGRGARRSSRPTASRSNGTCRASSAGWRPTAQLASPVAEWAQADASDRSRTKTSRERVIDQAAGAVRRRKFDPSAPSDLKPLRARGDAAVDRLPLARAPGRARLPAPGHPPARLRAEEAEAGIQARGLRALRRDCSTRSSAR